MFPTTNASFLLDTVKVSIPNEIVSKQENMTLFEPSSYMKMNRILQPMTVMHPSWIVSTFLEY